jgi:hypothetical protein
MTDIDEINYRLRPAKSIERKMMADILQKVAHIKTIRSYRYVGFGSIYFSEFRLFHRRLGIDDMVSIERVWQEKPRIEFNKPFDCIDIIMKEAEQALYEVEWDKPTILWLDYETKLKKKMLDDQIQQFFANAPAGSVFFITVNAQPDDIDDLDDQETHLKRLEEEFNPGNVPSYIDDYLTGTDLAAAFRELIIAKIKSDYLGDRNSGIPVEEKIEFNQLCNFVYNDSTLMFTLGGILNTAETKQRFEQANFDSLEFVSTDEQQYRIPVPNLTFAETRELEEMMPDSIDMNSIHAPEKDVEEYQQVYRFFPRFTESEL